MGISVQQYRSQIGTFQQSHSFKSRRKSDIFMTKCKSSKSLSRCPRYLQLVLLVFLNLIIISAGCYEFKLVSQTTAFINMKTFTPKSSRIVNFNFLAKITFGNRRTNGIKICQWNAGNGFLSNKQAELCSIVDEFKPHVLGVTESCFKKSHNVDDVKISGYQLFVSNTIKNPNLGVSRSCVYVHDDLNVKLRDDLMNDSFSSVWLELGKPRQKKLLLCVLYRDWQYLNQANEISQSIDAQLQRWCGFLDQWEQAIGSSSEIIVTGDVNLNFLEWGENVLSTNSQAYKLRSLTKELFDRIIPHGFVQLVTVPTRVSSNHKQSGLDHVYTNFPEKMSEIQAVFKGSSDHKLICCTRFTRSAVCKPRIVCKRSFKNFDQSKFREAIRKVSWWDIYMCNNVEEAVSEMSHRITSILNVMAPIKSFQVRKNYAPWISESAKVKIRERDLAQKNASLSHSLDDWLKYKALRNATNKQLKFEKKLWHKDKLDHLCNDPGTVWKNVKCWLGWSKGGPPTRLMENGVLVSKPSALARIMNEFFINKVQSLRSKLPSSTGDPSLLVKKLMGNKSCNLKFHSVHPDVVLRIISSLKSTHSCGVDNIDSRVIKLVKHELTPVITHVINLSIQSNIFPSNWKTAKVIPLHKKGEKIFPKNYRPVSLLPVFSKILEMVLFSQLVEYFENNGLMNPSHHGFRGQHSTCTALVQMIDSWAEAFDRGEISAVLMLDMSAAFDLVDHQILLKKLHVYGLEQETLDWIFSYLSERKQQVYVDGALSDTMEVSIGVPQGSILGPLFYIIFTNDLPEAVHDHLVRNNSLFHTDCKSCGEICCYADDSTFSVSSKDPVSLSEKICEKYQDIAYYMNNNKLVLNSNKTHLLVMASSQSHRKYGNFGVTLDTGSEMIEPIHSEKLLGAYISSDFSWNNHIRNSENSMFKSLTCKINALIKISEYASFKTTKSVATSLILSTLTYVIQVYGGCSNYLLKMLQVLQNKAARCVTRLPWLTPTSVLLKQCGWLSVRQLVCYHTLVLLFKVKIEKTPKHLYNHIGDMPLSNTRAETGRIQQHLLKDVRNFRTELARKTFIPRGISNWNSLPEKLRKMDKLDAFKKELKIWISTNVPVK